MFDTAATAPLTLSGATVITPEGPVEAALRVEAGRIAGLAAARGEGLDLTGPFPDSRRGRPAHRPRGGACLPAQHRAMALPARPHGA